MKLRGKDMARVSKDPEVRKNELLDVAEELFLEKGYDKTSVSDIVKKNGVAQGTFYYHFSSKEEIVEALAERFIQMLVAILQEIVDDRQTNAIGKIEIIAQRLLRYDDNKDYLLEYVHREKNAILHQKLAGKAFLTFSPLIRKILEQGIDEGLFSIPHPQEAAELLVMLLEYLQELQIFMQDKAAFAIKTTATANIIERILGAREGSIRLDR
jgi:AcrR family transcriptional regulator